MNNLKAWLRISSRAEKMALAEAAGTKYMYLYHLSNSEADYGRGASAELAGRLEDAAQPINAENPALPPLRRPDMCAACRQCPYAAQVLGNEIHASHFDILADNE